MTTWEVGDHNYLPEILFCSLSVSDDRTAIGIMAVQKGKKSSPAKGSQDKKVCPDSSIYVLIA